MTRDIWPEDTDSVDVIYRLTVIAEEVEEIVGLLEDVNADEAYTLRQVLTSVYTIIESLDS